MSETRVLLGVTGSVAAVKAPEIALRLFEQEGCSVKIILSQGGRHFWDQSKNYNQDVWNRFLLLLEAERSKQTGARLMIIDSSDEWRQWRTLGDPVMHIDLRNWADMMLVAPLSAHSLAKFRGGLCDDVVSSVVRAWDFEKPLILAPAMNTAMWDHKLTQEQLTAIQKFAVDPDKVIVIDPMVKTLACGDHGKGALAPVDDILQIVKSTIQSIGK